VGNPQVDRAWIEGRNPYSLARPSDWWLQLLTDYDAELVIMPSVKDCTYRLCRRVRTHLRPGLGKLATLHEHPDTTQMATFGLVPVTTVFPWATKSDKILRDLAARDTWTRTDARGNPNRVSDDLEYRETLVERRKERTYQSNLDHANSQAFTALQHRLGSRRGQVGGLRDLLRARQAADNSVISPPSPPGPAVGVTGPLPFRKGHPRRNPPALG
jgi:hypothetical protein